MSKRMGTVAVMAMLMASVMVVASGPPAAAAFPGENGRIVVQGYDTEGNYGIHTYEIDGSGHRFLSAGDSPRYSPDGTRIAFQRDGDIWVMDEDGSNQVQVTVNGNYETTPFWAPSGDRLVFSMYPDETYNPDVYAIDIDGTDRVRLTDAPGYDIAQEWSPDGSTILFASDADGPWTGSLDVWAMDADGSDPRNLTAVENESSSYEADAVWSPDGSRVAYFSDLEGRDIWTMNPDGTGQTRLAEGEKITWSPDGTHFAFGDGEIFVIGSEGSERTRTGIPGSWPDWQPVAQAAAGAFVRIEHTLDTGIAEGQQAMFSAHAFNLGPQDAIGVSIDVQMPPEVAVDSAEGPLGPCSIGSTVTCPIGTIGAYTSVSVTLTVTAMPGSGAVFTTSTATVHADNDLSPDNDTATLEFQIASPPLEITAKVTGATLDRNGVLTVRGTTTCSSDTYMYGYGSVRQRSGRAYANGEFYADSLCERGRGTFVAQVTDDPSRSWVAGKAVVMAVTMWGCDQWTCDDFTAEPATVIVKSGK
jgi:TolB protein